MTQGPKSTKGLLLQRIPDRCGCGRRKRDEEKEYDGDGNGGNDGNPEKVSYYPTIDAQSGASVEVGGDVISGNGNAIKISGEKVSVIVEGDVESEKALSINAGTAKGGELAVGGTVKTGENGATLIVSGSEGDVDEDKLPEIVVGAIEDVKNLNVQTADGTELNEQAKAEVLSNIKYIISQEDLENGTLTITKLNDGAEDGALDKDTSGTYDVAKAGETFKVNIITVSGYRVSKFNSGKATFSQNEDGSYTVTVPAGGGVNLSAVLELIEKAEEKSEPKEETKEESTESKAEDTAAKEENTATTTVSKSHGGGSGSAKGSSHAVAVTAGAGRTTLQNTPGSWQKNADNTWTYLDANGAACKSGWIVSNGRWYYADANGRIATGWMEINGVWYYFSMTESSENPEGAMLAGVTTPDGYKLDSSGAWLK